MPAAFRHVDSATLMGSWPYLGVGTTVDQKALEARATILGVKRETAAGYDAGGKALLIWIDGDVAGRSVSFPVGGPYTLDEIVTFINTDTGTSVASRDNGFLRLDSPTVGEASYLRLEIDEAALDNYQLFEELGLFSETESFGGEIAAAKHIDPDRQVALPGQMSLLHGEDFSSTALNRALFQLAINNDFSENLLSKKRVAVRKQYFVATYTPGANEGVVIPDDVYTGPVASPNTTQLEPYFAVLDSNGREYTREIDVVQSTQAVDFSVDSESGRQLVTYAGLFTFPADQTDAFIRPLNLTGPESALNGKLLPISGVIDNDNAVIDPVDLDTGTYYAVTQNTINAELVFTAARRAFVDGVYTDDTKAQRVEQWQEEKVGTTAIDRIVSADSLYVSTVDFETAGVQNGDIVEWTGYGAVTPYTNNGNYRVSEVVDRHTIKIVADDWGPAHLNPETSLGLGDIVVKTDGNFRKNPFLSFWPETNGVAPEPGVDLIIVYMGMGTVREATDDPSSFAAYGVRYAQEADDSIQRALLRMYGASAEGIDDVLSLSPLQSLEAVRRQVEVEHYPTNGPWGGRHEDIRPDHIDMWATVDNEQITFRSTSVDEAAGNIPKLRLQSSADDTVWFVDELGNIGFRENLGQYLDFDGGDGQPQNPSTAGSFFIALLVMPVGTYYYRVTSVDGLGQESTPSAAVSVVVDWATVDVVVLNWDPVDAARSYRVYRSTNPALSDEVLVNDIKGTSYFEASLAPTLGGPAPASGIRSAGVIRSDSSRSMLSGPLTVFGGDDEYAVSIGTSASDNKALSLVNRQGSGGARLAFQVSSTDDAYIRLYNWNTNGSWNTGPYEAILGQGDWAWYNNAGTPKMWLDIAAGHLGIDGGSGFAANPDAPLHVHVQGDDTIAIFEKHGGGDGDRQVDFNFTPARDMLEMDFAAGEVIGYDLSTGNVWVGTSGTDPATRLHVGGNIRAEGEVQSYTGSVRSRGTNPGFVIDDAGSARAVLKGFGSSAAGQNTAIDSLNTTLIGAGETALSQLESQLGIGDGSINETLYLSADGDIRLYTDTQDNPANFALWLTNAGHVFPGVSGTTALGGSSNKFGNGYIDTIYGLNKNSYKTQSAQSYTIGFGGHGHFVPQNLFQDSGHRYSNQGYSHYKTTGEAYCRLPCGGFEGGTLTTVRVYIYKLSVVSSGTFRIRARLFKRDLTLASGGTQIGTEWSTGDTDENAYYTVQWSGLSETLTNTDEWYVEFRITEAPTWAVGDTFLFQGLGGQVVISADTITPEGFAG